MRNEKCNRKSTCDDYKYNHCDGCGANKTTGNLISREALKEALAKEIKTNDMGLWLKILLVIDNAPTVEPEITEKQAILFLINNGWLVNHDKELRERWERPQGEYVDISKLRLMTVEECAGHTIDYAMGWKACVEWIKKGGKE